MLERVLAGFLAKKLGQYVTGLSPANIALSIFKGNLRLSNIDLNVDAVNGDKNPLLIARCFVGSLSVQLQWSQLFTAPVEVELADVYVVLRPSDRVDAAAVARARVEDRKREHLRRYEELHGIVPAEEDAAAGAGDGGEQAPSPWAVFGRKWWQRQCLKLLANLSVRITNVHVCVDDRTSIYERPFALGLTLSSLAANRANEVGPEELADARQLLRCIEIACALEAVSLYMDHTTTYRSALRHTRSPDFAAAMRAAVPRPGEEARHLYIIQPFNATIAARIVPAADLVAASTPAPSTPEPGSRRASLSDISLDAGSPPPRAPATPPPPPPLVSASSVSTAPPPPADGTFVQLKIRIERLPCAIDDTQLYIFTRWGTDLEDFFRRDPRVMLHPLRPEPPVRRQLRAWWAWVIAVALDDLRRRRAAGRWPALEARRRLRRAYCDLWRLVLVEGGRVRRRLRPDAALAAAAGLPREECAVEWLEARLTARDALLFRELARLRLAHGPRAPWPACLSHWQRGELAALLADDLCRWRPELPMDPCPALVLRVTIEAPFVRAAVWHDEGRPAAPPASPHGEDAPWVAHRTAAGQVEFTRADVGGSRHIIETFAGGGFGYYLRAKALLTVYHERFRMAQGGQAPGQRATPPSAGPGPGGERPPSAVPGGLKRAPSLNVPGRPVRSNSSTGAPPSARGRSNSVTRTLSQAADAALGEEAGGGSRRGAAEWAAEHSREVIIARNLPRPAPVGPPRRTGLAPIGGSHAFHPVEPRHGHRPPTRRSSDGEEEEGDFIEVSFRKMPLPRASAWETRGPPLPDEVTLCTHVNIFESVRLELSPGWVAGVVGLIQPNLKFSIVEEAVTPRVKSLFAERAGAEPPAYESHVAAMRGVPTNVIAVESVDVEVMVPLVAASAEEAMRPHVPTLVLGVDSMKLYSRLIDREHRGRCVRDGGESVFECPSSLDLRRWPAAPAACFPPDVAVPAAESVENFQLATTGTTVYAWRSHEEWLEGRARREGARVLKPCAFVLHLDLAAREEAMLWQLCMDGVRIRTTLAQAEMMQEVLPGVIGGLVEAAVDGMKKLPPRAECPLDCYMLFALKLRGATLDFVEEGPPDAFKFPALEVPFGDIAILFKRFSVSTEFDVTLQPEVQAFNRALFAWEPLVEPFSLTLKSLHLTGLRGAPAREAPAAPRTARRAVRFEEEEREEAGEGGEAGEEWDEEDAAEAAAAAGGGYTDLSLEMPDSLNVNVTSNTATVLESLLRRHEAGGSGVAERESAARYLASFNLRDQVLVQNASGLHLAFAISFEALRREVVGQEPSAENIEERLIALPPGAEQPVALQAALWAGLGPAGEREAAIWGFDDWLLAKMSLYIAANAEQLQRGIHGVTKAARAVPVVRSGLYVVPIPRGYFPPADGPGASWGHHVVCDVRSERLTRLRSTLQLLNKTALEFEVLVTRDEDWRPGSDMPPDSFTAMLPPREKGGPGVLPVPVPLARGFLWLRPARQAGGAEWPWFPDDEDSSINLATLHEMSRTFGSISWRRRERHQARASPAAASPEKGGPPASALSVAVQVRAREYFSNPGRPSSACIDLLLRPPLVVTNQIPDADAISLRLIAPEGESITRLAGLGDRDRPGGLLAEVLVRRGEKFDFHGEPARIAGLHVAVRLEDRARYPRAGWCKPRPLFAPDDASCAFLKVPVSGGAKSPNRALVYVEERSPLEDDIDKHEGGEPLGARGGETGPTYGIKCCPTMTPERPRKVVLFSPYVLVNRSELPLLVRSVSRVRGTSVMRLPAGAAALYPRCPKRFSGRLAEGAIYSETLAVAVAREAAGGSLHGAPASSWTQSGRALSEQAVLEGASTAAEGGDEEAAAEAEGLPRGAFSAPSNLSLIHGDAAIEAGDGAPAGDARRQYELVLTSIGEKVPGYLLDRRTRLVAITSRFTLVNRTGPSNLQYRQFSREFDTGEPVTMIESGARVSFHWSDVRRPLQLQLRLGPALEHLRTMQTAGPGMGGRWSGAISIVDIGLTYLGLRAWDGTLASILLIHVRENDFGGLEACFDAVPLRRSPYRIENRTNARVAVAQQGVVGVSDELAPHRSVPFAWHDPEGPRKVALTISNPANGKSRTKKYKLDQLLDAKMQVDGPEMAELAGVGPGGENAPLPPGAACPAIFVAVRPEGPCRVLSVFYAFRETIEGAPTIAAGVAAALAAAPALFPTLSSPDIVVPTPSGTPHLGSRGEGPPPADLRLSGPPSGLPPATPHPRPSGPPSGLPPATPHVRLSPFGPSPTPLNVGKLPSLTLSPDGLLAPPPAAAGGNSRHGGARRRALLGGAGPRKATPAAEKGDDWFAASRAPTPSAGGPGAFNKVSSRRSLAAADARERGAAGPSVVIRAALAGVQLSFADNERVGREVLLVTLADLLFNMEQREGTQRFQFDIKAVVVSNQEISYPPRPFPILLEGRPHGLGASSAQLFERQAAAEAAGEPPPGPAARGPRRRWLRLGGSSPSGSTPGPPALGRRRAKSADDVERPFVRLKADRLLVPGTPPTLLFFNYIGLLVQEFSLRCDEDSLYSLISYFVPLLARLPAAAPASQQELIYGGAARRPAAVYRVHIHTLQLHPLKANVTFRTSRFRRQRGRGRVLGRSVLLEAIGLIDVEDATLAVRSITLENVFSEPAQLAVVFGSYFRRDVLSKAARLVGSIDLLGNPVGVLRNLGTGLYQFLYEPAEALMVSPLDFAPSLGRGTVALVKGVIRGTTEATSKFTGAVGKYADFFSTDELYMRRRHRLTHAHARHVLEGVVLGAKSLALGFYQAAHTAIVAPYAGAVHGGVQGFGEGLLEALLGIGLHPLAGTASMVSKIAQGVGNTLEPLFPGTAEARRRAERKRAASHIRYPRTFGPRGEVVVYAEAQARSHFMMSRLLKGQFYRDEKVLFNRALRWHPERHPKAAEKGGILLVVTNHRYLAMSTAGDKYDKLGQLAVSEAVGFRIAREPKGGAVVGWELVRAAPTGAASRIKRKLVSFIPRRGGPGEGPEAAGRRGAVGESLGDSFSLTDLFKTAGAASGTFLTSRGLLVPCHPEDAAGLDAFFHEIARREIWLRFGSLRYKESAGHF